jgi:hypothetical protein
MRILLALILGAFIGGAAVWFYTAHRSDSHVRAMEQQVESGARAAGSAIQEKLRALELRSEDIREDLARSGQVVRRKAREAGHAIADATADARITAAVKGKLLADRELSGMSISVSTSEGVVTLSGIVPSPEHISKAMLLAMETEGVREVVSTLRVKAKNS